MNDKDQELFKRYRLALERLIAMGSEYYNEPERCAREVQERFKIDYYFNGKELRN